MAEFAKVIIDISHGSVDRPFTYRVPKELQERLRVGNVVRIPFGRGNTLRTGYCIELTDQAAWEASRIKEIADVVTVEEDRTEAVVAARQVALAAWLRQQYGGTMVQALKTVVTGNRRGTGKKKREIVLRLSKEEIPAQLALYEKKHQVARARLLTELAGAPRQPYSLITGKLHIAASTIRAMQEAGVLEVCEETALRDPVTFSEKEKETLPLTQAQQAIVGHILESYASGKQTTTLLHGVTGSGKTEVYLAVIEAVVQKGAQAIVLIPEIALTYQTLLRFYRRFGSRVSVVHSAMAEAEKRDQFERALRGEIDVIIGPRSALFTPFPHIGVILLDEEHETSYKNEQMPKYHAREVAEEIARLHGGIVILGSATPSLTAYDRAKSGEIRLEVLTERPTGQGLPTVEIADLREELRAGNRSILSRALSEKLADRLSKKEQSLLFINRRGMAGFVSCRACGYVAKCPHCDVSLSLHRKGRLLCHYCGYETPMPKACPECGSPYILGFRAGTEQIEEVLQKTYPEARILRMDADTTARKGAYEKILSAFASEEADILLGTQMIVKGHDFPKVTLVGALLADLSLFAGDYTGAERTFDLLAQAAGRAGRGDRPGEVVIQTYQPEHYAIVHAAAQDYRAFYEEEIAYRRLLAYPPAAHMLAIQYSGLSEDRTLTCAAADREVLSAMDPKLLLIGPAAARTAKLRDRYRFVLYIKATKYDTLVRCRDRVEEKQEENARAGVLVQFDFDPVAVF